MKKILPYLSIKNILISLAILGLSYQNTISTNDSINVSAISVVSESAELSSDIQAEDDADGPATTLPTDTPKLSSALIIKALNPGYTIDGTRDVGEFIELQNTTNASLSLAGYSLRYTNSSGKQTTIINFSDGSSMVGEFLLLRLARTTNSNEAEAVYTTTLAMSNARLEVLYYGDVMDQVCWSKDEECADAFTSKTPSTLVRDAEGKFSHLFTEYQVHYNAQSPTLYLPPDPDDTPSQSTEDATKPSETDSSTDPSKQDPEPPAAVKSTPKCRGLEFSEVLTYYSEDKSEQFIEIYNGTDSEVDLTGCNLLYKKKLYPLTGKVVTDGQIAFYPNQFTPALTLTKDPSSSNTIELIDTDETVVDILVYNHGQKKTTSYAKFIEADGSESWNLTYAPTPGATNIYQEFRTCPSGKVINPATGNCIKVTSAATSTTTECPAGKYRNPLTGRCKSIESTTSEPKPCAEGYERNPETNRCRKIKAENEGAGYALVPTTHSDQSTFVAFGIVMLLVSLGVIYIILQFRHEIARAVRKARQGLHHVRKDLIARGISFHRHKKP